MTSALRSSSSSAAHQPQVSSQPPVPPRHSAAEPASRTESTRSLPLYRQGDGTWRQLLEENLQRDRTPHHGNVSLKTPKGQVMAAPYRKEFVLLDPKTQKPVLHPSKQPVQLMRTQGNQYVPMPKLQGGFDSGDIPPQVVKQMLERGDSDMTWTGEDGYTYRIIKQVDRFANTYYEVRRWYNDGYKSAWGIVSSLKERQLQTAPGAPLYAGMTNGEIWKFNNLESIVNHLNSRPEAERYVGLHVNRSYFFSTGDNVHYDIYARDDDGFLEVRRYFQGTISAARNGSWCFEL